MTGASSGASAPVLEIAGCVWRDATAADAHSLAALADLNNHRAMFDLPRSEDEFAERVNRPGFVLAMLCLRGAKPVGVGATRLRNWRSLNLSLVSFFEEPASSTLLLAAYVRQVFWSLPMHRIYLQLPLVSGAEAYRRLFTSVGFIEEGVINGHGIAGAKPLDVAVLGILRRDFEDWCQRNESSLSL